MMKGPSGERSADQILLPSQKGTLASKHLSQEKDEFLHHWHLLSLCQGQGHASFPMSRNLEETLSLGYFFFLDLIVYLHSPTSSTKRKKRRKKEEREEMGNVLWLGKKVCKD